MCSCCCFRICVALLRAPVRFVPRVTFYLCSDFSWADSKKITLKRVGCEISSLAHVQDCPVRNERCSWPQPTGTERGDGLLLSVLASGVLFIKEILSSSSLSKSPALASNVPGFMRSAASFIYAFPPVVVLLACWFKQPCCPVTKPVKFS